MMNDIFIDFLTEGNLSGIIYMNKINIHANDDNGLFIWACYFGHLHIVEYFVNLYKIRPNYTKINIHINDEYGFRIACEHGYKHIVKYLINLHKIQPIYAKINIHANNEDGFIVACNNGHKHIVKYLLSCGCYLERCVF